MDSKHKLENKEHAKSIALNFLNNNHLVPIGISTLIEGENIWLVLYNSKQYIETGIYGALLGNTPYILDKNTWEMISAPSGKMLHDFLICFKLDRDYPTETKFMTLLAKELEK